MIILGGIIKLLLNTIINCPNGMAVSKVCLAEESNRWGSPMFTG